MRVAVTGTPGTGKTTATDLVDVDLEVIHLNEVVREEGLTKGIDEERGAVVADLEAVEAWLDGRDDLLVESHLAHLLAADRVVVLRCHPEELARRLRGRDDPRRTVGETAGTGEPSRALARFVRENAESEALDIVLTEAVEEHGLENVYEIDTTDLSPEAVAREIERAVAGEREPSAGDVDFLEYL